MSKQVNEQKNTGIYRMLGSLVRRFDFLLILFVFLLLFIYPKLWKNLFVIGDFMPHGVCYFWIPELVALHLISDSIIGLSYVAISVTLGVLVYKARKEIPFQKVFVAFGMFIIACGMTHFMEIWTTFYASYWLSGYVKLATAVVSAATALFLPPLIPKIIELIHSAKISEQRKTELEKINESLKAEIAERKRIEKDLRLRELWLNEAQSLTKVGSWEWDLTKNDLKWTDELYRIFGVDKATFEPTFDNGVKFLHPDDKENVVRELKNLVDGESLNDQEYRIINTDGETIYVHSKRKAIRNEQNEVVRIIGALQDVTKRKKDFDTIYQLNKDLNKRTVELEISNNELEAFSYSVSHDLRTPLRSINGFSSVLLEDYGEIVDDEGKKYLEFIKTATKNMAQIIDDLLRLSRITRSEIKIRTVNLSKLAEKVTDSLERQSENRKVSVKIEPDLITQGDEGLLQIVLENLFVNAWKFTSKKPEAEIVFGKEIKDDQTVFYVRDNGAGFDVQFKDKLFTAFQRLHDKREFEGTGIGLAIVHRIIHRHGGNIWAEGEIDKGATFYFTI